MNTCEFCIGIQKNMSHVVLRKKLLKIEKKNKLKYIKKIEVLKMFADIVIEIICGYIENETDCNFFFKKCGR